MEYRSSRLAAHSLMQNSLSLSASGHLKNRFNRFSASMGTVCVLCCSFSDG